MECPNCHLGTGVVLYNDIVICNKCRNELCIDYCMCNKCHYSWRENNGVFLDGGMVNMGGLSEAFDQIDKLLNMNPEQFENPSMFDTFYRCIRCGEPAVRDGNTFTCTVCDFKWEILLPSPDLDD